MPLTPFNNCFRTTTTKKTPFPLKNGNKMPIFTPNQCFLGPGGQFVPPVPYLEGLGRKKQKLRSIPLNPINKCFRGVRTKKTLFGARKMAEKFEFLP